MSIYSIFHWNINSRVQNRSAAQLNHTYRANVGCFLSVVSTWLCCFYSCILRHSFHPIIFQLACCQLRWNLPPTLQAPIRWRWTGRCQLRQSIKCQGCDAKANQVALRWTMIGYALVKARPLWGSVGYMTNPQRLKKERSNCGIICNSSPTWHGTFVSICYGIANDLKSKFICFTFITQLCDYLVQWTNLFKHRVNFCWTWVVSENLPLNWNADRMSWLQRVFRQCWTLSLKA